MKPPYRDGKMHVMSVKCDTCIFRPGNLMHLEEGRVEQMTTDAVRDQGHIPCHKRLGADDERAICRGFFDVHKHDVQALQLAERMGILALVTPPSKEEVDG